MFTTALTRRPAHDFTEGLTSAVLGKPEFDLALQQHADYVSSLQQLDLQVVELEPVVGFPDACFVEDVAIITPDVAIITRPGAG